MKQLLVACLAFALLTTPALAAPLEAYGRLPSLSDVTISPDGSRVAYVTQKNGESTVRVEDLATRKLVGSVKSGGYNIRGLVWAGSTHIVIVSSNASQIADRAVRWKDATVEVWQGVVLDIAGRNVRPLFYPGVDEEHIPILAGMPFTRVIDGTPFVFFEAVSYVNSSSRLSLFRTNVEKRSTRLVQVGDSNTRNWILDSEAKVLAQGDFFDHNDERRLKVRHDGALRIIPMPEGVSKQYFLSRGRTPNSVVVAYTKDKKDLISEIDLNTLAWGEPIDTDPDRFIFDPVTHTLIGYSKTSASGSTYTFFDPVDQKTWNSVRAAYPGQYVELASWSNDRRTVAVYVDSPTEGAAYAFVDLDARKGDWIGDVYDGLKAADISPVKPISYKAADGLEITGYLTTPNGVEARNLPLIVLPHGGPASRDTAGFDWWSQALASRGYAVLQPNFRGSDGFGRAFMEAGYGEWGKKMQTDLSDGVRYLASTGVIDPKRVCIVGASYGGYAALAGAAIDRGVYRCAVSVNGVSDLRRMLISDRENKGESALRYWSEFMGVDGARDKDLSAISPAAQAAQVDIPVLLIHGQEDTVVRYEQSQIMHDALRLAGKYVELVPLKGEDHWLSDSSTRLRMLQATVGFIEKHNPPPPAEARPAP